MENKTKHLEMIQGIINRLAHCSFLLKGWTVVLVAGLFALAAKDSKAFFIYLAYFPALAFWALDGYFLRQERLYRKLYDKVRKIDAEDVDFAMNTSPIVNEVDSWYIVSLSKTLVIFHGTIVLTIAIVMVIILAITGSGEQNG